MLATIRDMFRLLKPDPAGEETIAALRAMKWGDPDPGRHILSRRLRERA
jgi:hypothetical protein